MDKSGKTIRSVIKERRLLLFDSNVSYDDTVKVVGSKIKSILFSKCPVIVAIIGGAAAGKSTFSRSVTKMVNPNTVIISTDDFVIGTRDYRNLNFSDSSPLSKYDFDLLRAKLEDLKVVGSNEQVHLPMYDDSTGAAVPIIGEKNPDVYKSKIIEGPINLIIIEGDFLPDCALDILIYLHIPDEIRLENRVQRDLEKRGYLKSSDIKTNFNIRQKKQHFPYTLPVAMKADIILFGNKDEDGIMYIFDIYQEGNGQ